MVLKDQTPYDVVTDEPFGTLEYNSIVALGVHDNNVYETGDCRRNSRAVVVMARHAQRSLRVPPRASSTSTSLSNLNIMMAVAHMVTAITMQ